jgi:hypothetical protein
MVVTDDVCSNSDSIYSITRSISSLSVEPRVKPGVSTKHMFRSSTASRLLFLRRRTRLSPVSVHQCGYGLVLAWISIILAVPAWPELRLRDFDLGGVGRANELERDRGSTCTISSQIWTIERTRDVFPRPVLYRQRHITTALFIVY